MKRAGIAWALVLILGSSILSSCDAANSGGGLSEAQLPVCAPNTFRLTGTIDNMSIDVTERGIGGYAQDDAGGELDVGDPLVDGTEMTLFWTKGLFDGQTGAATGTFRLAAGSFSGQSFCAGGSSEVHVPKDQTLASIQFVLNGLSSGDACDIQRGGTLRGCLN